MRTILLLGVRCAVSCAVAFSLAACAPAHALTDFPGLPEAVSEDVACFAPVFDFAHDSCYPAPAVAPDGRRNGGLRDAGHITGECRHPVQLQNANTYCRTVEIVDGSATYRGYMYALYFEKDQAVSGTHFGHRHDWEYVIIWTTNDRITHASFSQHGTPKTIPASELSYCAQRPTAVRAVYAKDGLFTHFFRPALKGERAQNERDEFITPTLVEWGLMKSRSVSNLQFRQKLNTFDFGEANCSVNDRHFPSEISKNPPPGYPPPAKWRTAASATPTAAARDYSKPPPIPAGLIARWHVLPNRDPDRDNRAVNLPQGQQARLVVHLPDPLRASFRCTLKHDKRRAFDQPRTTLLSHGSLIDGAAHNWARFGTRIYLGDRGGLEAALRAAPKGFFVDLILIE